MLAGGILLAGPIGYVDQAQALASGTILAGAGVICMVLRTQSHARRRSLSLITAQSVTHGSPFYQRSMTALIDAPDIWYDVGAVERALTASDPDARQLGHDLMQLLGFFNTVAVGISQGAIDEPVMRRLLHQDLQALHQLARSAAARYEELQAAAWLADRWSRQNGRCRQRDESSRLGIGAPHLVRAEEAPK